MEATIHPVVYYVSQHIESGLVLLERLFTG